MATFGKVSGQFKTMIVDNNDPDQLPQIVALSGKIFLTLNVSKIIDTTDNVNPVVFGTSVLHGVLDGNGILSTPNSADNPSYADLWVPSTDDPNYLPETNLAYTVEYALKDPNGVKVPIKSHMLSVPAGATVNLGNFIEPDGAPVQSLAAAQASAALAIAAANSAIKTINGNGPDSSGDIIITTGGGGGTVDLSSYYTKSESNAQFQPVGAYALVSDLTPYVQTSALTAYALKTDLTPYALTSALTAVSDVANAAAPKNSPALTGIPTAQTAAVGTNTNQLATTAHVKASLDALIAGAPGALDTLKEISDQLATDESAVSGLTVVIGTKYTKPAGGIPKTDLTAALQSEISLATTAIKPTDQPLLVRRYSSGAWEPAGVVPDGCELLFESSVTVGPPPLSTGYRPGIDSWTGY